MERKRREEGSIVVALPLRRVCVCCGPDTGSISIAKKELHKLKRWWAPKKRQKKKKSLLARVPRSVFSPPTRPRARAHPSRAAIPPANTPHVRLLILTRGVREHVVGFLGQDAHLLHVAHAEVGVELRLGQLLLAVLAPDLVLRNLVDLVGDHRVRITTSSNAAVVGIAGEREVRE